MEDKNKNILDASPMPLEQFLSFGILISEALHDVHRKDFIHGDIRPDNIIWVPDSLKVTLADSTAAGAEVPLFNTARLPYISPEQTGRMNRLIDQRTDLYSLGVVFYELLTGEPLFIAEDSLEIIHNHIAKKPNPPHECRPEIPEQISAIVMRLLEKNPEDRYQSAFGLQHDLQKCAEQLTKRGSIERFKLGEFDFTGTFQIPQKLYGREDEIKTLLDSFEKISAGATELLLVAGYSGTGKTALVHEVHRPITEKRGYFIEGKFDQYQRNIPYFAWGQAFSGLISQLLMESDSRLNNWKAQILEAVGSNGKLITDVIPNLELVIGPQPDVPELDGQAMQNRFNYVFQRFIKVIARQNHPLVVFLDDLQWIDTASLNFLISLLTDSGLAHFLVVGAYRENEVDEAHPLMMGVAKLQEANVNLERLTLKNLSEADINALCAETLRCPQSESRPLAQLIYVKTGGNAFFSHQMLHSLNEESLLTFDISSDQWQWDLDELIKLDISDNVIDLIIAKVRKLPEATQEILQLAACIGSQFDKSTLTMLTQEPAEAVNTILQASLKENILLPAKGLYKFVHDRIQQAIYSLINPDSRAHIHRQIGFSLIENTPANEIDDKIFDIVSHLNQALDSIDKDEDRLLISQLNLRAAQKAKSAGAFAYSKEYIEVALDLLREDSWKNQYDLTLSLHNENGHLAALTGQFKQIETAVNLIQANAKSILDQVPIQMTRIEAETLQYNPSEALQIGLNALKDLGIEIPMNPSQEYLQDLKDRLIDLLANRPKGNWAKEPNMTDETALAISSLLASEMSTSYICHPPLFPVFSLRNAILALEYGVSYWTPHAFAGIATVEIFLADHNTPVDVAKEHLLFAKEMNQVARELMEHPNTAASQTKTLVLMSLNTAWIEPIENAVEMSKATYRSGNQIGDILYGAYGILIFSIEGFGAGMDLTDYQRQLSDYVNILNRMGQITVPTWVSIAAQMAQNFMESSSEPHKLLGDYFDEDIWLPEALALKDMTGRHLLSINKLILAYHFDVDSKLDDYVREAEELLVGGRAMFSVAEFYFYASLSKLRLAGKQDTEERRKTINLVDSYLQLVKVWSGFVPSTFQHKYELITAERARLTGDLDAALSHYEHAISGARTNGFIHEEALANELYGRFWIERDNVRFAGPLMGEAHRLYQKWGALAKAEHLTERYPEWVAKEHVPTADEAEALVERMAENLDLHTILKASQKIAGEIELKSLLSNMMNIVIENAGAQKGSLVMEEEGQWMIVAGGDFESNEAFIQKPLNVVTSEEVSPGIVNYVTRTQESVVLNDAVNEGDFTSDINIQKNQSKSILCTPLINQGKVSGILYLENNLATGAFTHERVELLKLLSSQMAMALDNAKLYSSLEERVAERTKELTESEESLRLAKEEAEAANKAKSTFLANMSHELRTPLNIILGYSQLMQRDPEVTPEKQESLDTINRSGEHLLELINDVLELTKIESGYNALDETDFDLHELLYSLESMFGIKAKAKGLEFKVILAKAVPHYLYADQRKLRQIIFNLLSNAVKFTAAGQITVNIDHKTNEKGLPSLYVEVADSGPGIAAEEMDALFEPFEQTEAGLRSQEGTGLGLPLSRRFVKLMGGNLSVDSEPGRGSVFKFDILAPEGQAVVSRKEERQVTGLEAGQTVPNILVVEDLTDSRWMLMQLLKTVGFQTCEAENGKEALDKWRELKPDMILMDIGMPVMDGYEAVRHIREAEADTKTSSSKITHVPIVAVTASAFEGDRKKILTVGCDDVVSKPFREADLFNTIAEYLGLKYVYQEAEVKTAEAPEITREQISTLPTALLNDLRDAVHIGHASGIRKIIEQIEDLDPGIAGSLRALVDRYDYQEFNKILDPNVVKS
jgi:predicted ATPase/signal transduction histidine kinase/CheY-like chemotaxis protein